MNDLLAGLRAAGTAAVSDALDMLGVDGGLSGVVALTAPVPVAGPAYLVGFEPAAPGTPAPAADYVDDVPPGHVVVLANSGRLDCTVWGDLLTLVARRNGLAATVVDGCVRDVDRIRDMEYPVFARAAYMKSGKNRARCVSVGEPVRVCGVTVEPGDFVVADASGALVVPAALLADVAEVVAKVTDCEARVRASLAGGARLSDARAAAGYDRFAYRAR